jgi:hypothetical protein
MGELVKQNMDILNQNIDILGKRGKSEFASVEMAVTSEALYWDRRMRLSSVWKRGLFTSQSPPGYARASPERESIATHGRSASRHYARTGVAVKTSTLSSNPWQRIAARRIFHSEPEIHFC